MVREAQDWFILSDGMKLYEKTWEPSIPPRARLIFFHGFSDRSELHYYLFPTLASEPYNITCHAIDQRGWGKSVHHASQRGLTGTTSQVLADIDEYIAYISTKDTQRVPLFIMGHSMGGQQVLHYILTTNPSLTTARSSISGAIIEAPYLKLDPSSQPSSLLIMAGRVAAMISPKSQMKQHLDPRYITRDPEVNRAWAEDPLCHDYGTLEGLRDMIKRGDDLVALSNTESGSDPTKKLGLSRSLPVSIFMAHGTADRVTAFDPSKKLFDALVTSNKLVPSGPNAKTFKAYEGAYHKIHAEPDGIGVAFSRDVGDWILEIVDSKGKGNEESSGQKKQQTTVEQRVEKVGRGLGDSFDSKVKAKL